MCGRFAQIFKYDQLKRLLDEYEILNQDEQLPIRFNVAPGQMVPAIIYSPRGNLLSYFHWGLVPSWSKHVDNHAGIINIRSETILDKPTFRSGLTRRRCIIPVSGFYEWQKPSKQPYYFQPTDREFFALAGMWDRWVSPDGTDYQSLGIITCPANRVMKGIHERMPVILLSDKENAWLNPLFQDAKMLSKLLLPYPDNGMTLHPVSTFVNNVRNDNETCIEEIRSA